MGPKPDEIQRQNQKHGCLHAVTAVQAMGLIGGDRVDGAKHHDHAKKHNAFVGEGCHASEQGRGLSLGARGAGFGAQATLSGRRTGIHRYKNLTGIEPALALAALNAA